VLRALEERMMSGQAAMDAAKQHKEAVEARQEEVKKTIKVRGMPGRRR
jgi:hypothetical protein